MVNQVILVGKLVEIKEETVDRGTPIVILSLSAGDVTVPVRTADGIAENCLKHLSIGATVGAKCRLNNDQEGLVVLGEKITFISGGKQ